MECAEAWWAKTNEDGTFDEYDDKMKRLLLRKPTLLQVESLLCEIANRQLCAREAARRKAAGDMSMRTAKGTWTPRAPYVRKNLDSVASASAGADGQVVQ